MRGFIFGFLLGVSSSTVGFSGLAPIFDNSVRSIQQTTINAVQKSQQQQIQNYDFEHPGTYARTAN